MRHGSGAGAAGAGCRSGASCAKVPAVSRTFRSDEAECLVFTFKEGLLSAVAHDLKLRLTSFSIEVDGDRVKATFAAASIEVVTARKDGVDVPGAVSDSDKKTIAENARDDVLATRKHPTISFASTKVEASGDAHRVEGQLTLHGATRPVAFTTKIEGDREIAEVTLHQPDWGITPYKAMLGTLRIQPDVRVRVAIPRT
jgi:polyisoprenoid-binding protein YceI